MESNCSVCQNLKRFCSSDGEWMDVCTAEEWDEEGGEDGLYRVSVVDKDVFDARHCLNFKACT